MKEIYAVDGLKFDDEEDYYYYMDLLMSKADEERNTNAKYNDPLFNDLKDLDDRIDEYYSEDY